MKLLVLLTLVLTNVAWSQTSYVPMGRLLKKGGYEIMGTGRYWNSSSRYDVDGEEVPFEESESFSYLEGEFQGLYGATKELQFGFNANFRQNQAKYLDSGTEESITSTGLQSIGGSMSYAFKPVERLHYTLEGFYRYHPYTNQEADSTDRKKNFVLGDDGGDYGAGLAITYAHPSQNFLGVRAHYRRPGSELSAEINWQVEGALAWKYFALVAGAGGIYSLNNDAYSDDPAEKPALNTGGSQMYNSINRAYTAPYGGFNIALGKKWRLEARYHSVIAATSYDTGSMVTVSLATRVENDSTKEIDNEFKEYDLEANVVRLSPKKQFVIIDKGLSSDVQMGQRFDLFHFDYLGGNVLLARAVVIQVNADQAVLKVTSRFSNKHEIKEGVIARGLGR